MKEGNDDVTYSLNVDGSTVRFNGDKEITNTLPDAIGTTVIYYNPNTGKFSTTV